MHQRVNVQVGDKVESAYGKFYKISEDHSHNQHDMR